MPPYNVFYHLDSCFGEVQPEGQLLPGEDVRVLGLLKGPLQLVQLEGGEGGARPPDLPRLVRVVQLALLEAEGELLLEHVLAGFGLWIRFFKRLASVLLATFS